MKATILREIGSPLQIETIQVDKPGPYEVLIGTMAVSVCHSDLRSIEGTAEIGRDDLVTPLAHRHQRRVHR